MAPIQMESIVRPHFPASLMHTSQHHHDADFGCAQSKHTRAGDPLQFPIRARLT